MEKVLKNTADSGRMELSPHQPGTFTSAILPRRVLGVLEQHPRLTRLSV